MLDDVNIAFASIHEYVVSIVPPFNPHPSSHAPNVFTRRANVSKIAAFAEVK